MSRSCIGTVVVFGAVAVATCGCRHAAERPMVVVYTSVDQVHSEPVLKAFEAASGITVLPIYDVEATKTTGLANRLLAEKSKPRADVWWNGEFAQTLALKRHGVLAAYRPPTMADLPPESADPEGFWAAVGGRARVLLVNTDLVAKADYPRGIRDLLDPKWGKGQALLAQPLFGTTATEAAALYASMGPDAALEFYRAVARSGVRVVDGNSVVRDLVAAGQAKVGMTDTDDAQGAIERGAPLKAILPDQNDRGTLVIPGTVALVAGGPHPDQGKALVDFLTGPEAEGLLMKSGFCQIPLHANSPVPQWLGVSQIRRMQVSFDDVCGNLERARRDLREVFLR